MSDTSSAWQHFISVQSHPPSLLLIQTALRRGTASLPMYSSNHHTENTVRAPSCVTLAALLWLTDLGHQSDVVMAPKIHHPSRNQYRRGRLAPSSCPRVAETAAEEQPR